MFSNRSQIKRRVPLRRRVPVRKKRDRPRRGPDRSPDYLAWIRTLACVICCRPPGDFLQIEAAHTNALGGRGIRQKACKRLVNHPFGGGRSAGF